VKDLATFVPFALIVLVFWFLVIRPARRRQQEVSSVQKSIEPGAQVMLGSGIFGTVMSIADDTVQLEVAPGTTVKVARQAVVRVVDKPSTEPDGPVAGTDPDSADGSPTSPDGQ
jgi:preprotein translocase subunit YajC